MPETELETRLRDLARQAKNGADAVALVNVLARYVQLDCEGRPTLRLRGLVGDQAEALFYEMINFPQR